MINKLHARLFRPERGWDPVPEKHAKAYGMQEWQSVDMALLDHLEQLIGGLSGKRVLDLGGGPGQYSAAFAQRGACVTWHDISRRYLEMARENINARGLGVQVRYSLGYLDEAPDVLDEPFDLVFNRICWYYGFDDASFAKVLYRLAGPGGWIYVDTNHSRMARGALKRSARLRTWLNDRFSIKIGHPYPPHGRVAELFLGYPFQQLFVDYRSRANDRILMQKSSGEP